MRYIFHLSSTFKLALIAPIAWICLSSQTMAQSSNLVPNASFSQFRQAMQYIPKYADEHFTKNVQHWYSAADPSLPPHFITPQLKTDLGQKHLFASGDTAFAGMVLGIGGGVGGPSIGIELNEALVLSKRYLVKMRVAVPLYSKKRRYPAVLPDNFGILFSKEKIVVSQTMHGLIKEKPQVNYAGTPLQPFQWIELAQVFQPQTADLKFLTLGIFCPEQVSLHFNNFYYYFIDSVYVAETNLVAPPLKSVPTVEPFEPFSIYFDSGSFNLSQQQKTTLDRLVRQLRTENPVSQIQLTGYADYVGEAASNLELSKKRTLAVFEYLTRNGLDSNRISLKWEGEANVAQLAQSRRVDISLLDISSIQIDRIKPLPVDWQSVYRFSTELEQDGDMLFKDIAFTCIGKYERAAPAHKKTPEPRSIEDVETLQKGKPTDAFSYLLKSAFKENLLIFNEAHNRPKHRAFVALLLDSLYQQGYRYLGLEMLFPSDTGINARGYPVLSSGLYSQEPVAGDLIRMALKTGYEVFGYDAEGEEIEVMRADWAAKDEAFVQLSDSEQEMNSRDRIQADKIARKMQADPSGKYLILAGFGHIREDFTGNWQPMAYQLKKHYQINPFTVDQVAGDLDINNASFYLHSDISAFSKATIILQKNLNQSFTFKEYDLFRDTFLSYYDVQIIHPATKNGEHGRPLWLDIEHSKKVIPVSGFLRQGAPLPCLIFAYYASEDIRYAVPADVVEVNSKESPALLLRPGSYEILIKYQNGQIFKKKAIVQ